MPKNFKAVIFDFDGLLVDSEPSWDETYYIFLKEHNVVASEKVESEMFGRGLREAIEIMINKMGLKGEVNELVSDYRRLFYDLFLKRDDILMPGVLEILNKCQKNKIKIGLTSGGHTGEKLEELLKQNQIDNFFSVIVSSDDVPNGKPAPDVYLEAIKRLNVDKGEAIALEDSPNGVMAAVAAGVAVYGVNPDERIREELLKADADKIFSSLFEVKL